MLAVHSTLWLVPICDTLLPDIDLYNSFLKDKKHLSLSEGDFVRLNANVKILKDTSHYHSSRFSDVDVALLLKLLKTWPVDVLFPGNHALIYNLILSTCICNQFSFCVIFFYSIQRNFLQNYKKPIMCLLLWSYPCIGTVVLPLNLGIRG